ncbi:MAG: transporter substrate-binding domain-containing protein [Bacillota bacterium]|nr:transporter substrate-binding domain-containing protein [Bacillota bacterium]
MRKSRVVAILLALVMAVTAAMAGCAPKTDKAAQTGQQSQAQPQSMIERVRKKGELVVGTAPGYYPFEMIDKKGNIIGFDIDIAKEIADALGVKLTVQRYGFDGLIPALQTGNIDVIIAGMTITAKRALAVSFTNPYYATGQVLMVNKNIPNVRSWQDLDKKGYTIGVSLGTTGAMLAKQLFKNATVKDFDIFPDACLALSTGKIHGIVYDEPGVRVYASQHPESVYGVYELMSVENLGMAVQKDDFSSLQWLNSFLYSYKDGPAYKAAVRKWFEEMTWIPEVEIK